MPLVSRTVKSHSLRAFAALAALFLAAPPGAHAQTYSLASATLIEGPAAGSDSVLLSITPSATWTAAANETWLHVAAGSAGGTGNANVLLSFDANTGATRTGTFTIGGQTLTVTQAGSTYAPTSALTAIVPAGLLGPEGVAVDSNGNVYVADTMNNAIKMWTAATQKVTTLVSAGLASPQGLAVDGNGNVYIADTGNSAIKEYTAATQTVSTLVASGLSSPQGVAVDGQGNVYFSSGTIVKEWTAATRAVSTLVASGLTTPEGVAVDGDGNVYIADSGSDAIYEWTAATQTMAAIVSSGLNAPQGVALDGNGNVYIADTKNNAIKEWMAATEAVSTLVSVGLSSPGGAAIDGHGNLYVADTGNSALKEWTATTKILSTIDSGLNQPEAVAVDAAGNVYIADTNNSAIKKWTAASQTISTLVSSGLSSPRGVAVDANGNLYIADTGNNAVKEWSADTESISTLVSSGIHSPSAVAVDAAGNVFLADSNDNAVKKWTAASQTLSTLVSSGLSFPTGVAVDSLGNVYIADTDNLAIKKYTLATQSVTSLISSGLSGPYGVAVDGSGNVYIADASSNAIKKWTASTQALTTVASGLSSPRGVAVDGVGNVYLADSLSCAIAEALQRAYLDPTTRLEPNSAGADAVPAVLPSTVNLQGVFAPFSDQSWLTIGGPISGGVLGFSFSADPSPGRIAHITALGRSITIAQGAPPPIAMNVSVLTDSAEPLTINVLTNDSSPLFYSLAVTSITTPSLGRVKINSNNTITYTPKTSFANITATDSFTYTIGDGHGGSATGTVTIRNPFPPFQGNYDGLVIASGVSDGYLTVSLAGSGSFTGALKLAGVGYSFHGAFGLDGIASLSIKVPGPTPITVSLTLDLAMSGNLSAAIQDANGATYLANTGPREPYTAANPAPSAGSYTALLPAPPAPTGTAATASVTVSKGEIAHIDVTSGGNGYVTPPRVVIAGAPGAGATASAVLTDGSVSKITIKAAGKGYAATGTTVTIDPPSAGLPQGTGWAIVSVSASGAVTMAGKLGDGTAFAFGGFVDHGLSGDFFALYEPLYTTESKPSAPGSVAGIIPFEPSGNSKSNGELAWIKPAQTAGALYESGFGTSIGLWLSDYAAPHKAQVLTFTDTTAGVAKFELSLGNLTAPIDHMLSVSSLNVVMVADPGTDKLSLKITSATGLITGSFKSPTTDAVTAITGVVYQKGNMAAGLFLGPSQAGSAQLIPQ